MSKVSRTESVWVIANVDPSFPVYSPARTRNEAIEKFCLMAERDWRANRADGWRCVRAVMKYEVHE